MNDSPSQSSSTGSFGRSIVAVLVLVLAGWLLLHFLIGIASAVAGFVVFILAVVAVIWAVRVLL
ncbi:MAG TPA: hypothetical protein VIC06_05825 [Solirubrobacteraceae bacterium]|jgi:hypothetical protein